MLTQCLSEASFQQNQSTDFFTVTVGHRQLPRTSQNSHMLDAVTSTASPSVNCIHACLQVPIVLCTSRSAAMSVKSKCLVEKQVGVDCEGCSLSQTGRLTLVQVRQLLSLLGAIQAPAVPVGVLLKLYMFMHTDSGASGVLSGSFITPA